MLERFCDYFEANPQIWTLFKRYAKTAIGFDEKIGAKCIFENIRWKERIERGNGKYKINNNFPTYYARLLTETDPAFDGFFQFRGGE